MRFTSKYTKTSIRIKCCDKGISLEEEIRQAIATNSPIEGNAPMIYTPASEGVLPQYDPRTDKQNLALEAMDKFQGQEIMKGFIKQTEYDENGFDGKNMKPKETETPKNN